jgi:rsbT co-antagonist protein RsbR
MTLAERLAALETSAVPTWVFDADHFRFRWANPSALELWRATDPAELLARDFSDMSTSTQRRIQGYLVGFREGHPAEETWTLYPRGKPVLLRLYFSGIALDDGRMAALIQAVAKEQSDPDLVRSVEALRHTSVAVTLLDLTGAILMQNPACSSTFGPELPFPERFADPALAATLLAQAGEGEVFHAEVRVRTLEGEHWHAVEARRLIDPATGAGAVLVHQTDETTRLGAERTAEEKSRLVEELHATLAPHPRRRGGHPGAAHHRPDRRPAERGDRVPAAGRDRGARRGHGDPRPDRRRRARRFRPPEPDPDDPGDRAARRPPDRGRDRPRPGKAARRRGD